jgi:hypothetical protein
LITIVGSHLRKTKFFDSEKDLTFRWAKYIPLDNPSAFHILEYIPGSISSETSLVTSLPNESKIIRFTNDFTGIVKVIVVTGLNGFG